MAKEGYKPTSGMQSAARRAIKLKEQGKAKGAGTAVGWTRAGQLARGETLSLSTVKRMYSYFSRHEVDKKGKDWDNAESPSNGKIMWLAWGGDAGFSWSRKIVEREKNMKKSLETNEIVEEIKNILEDVVNPPETVIEILDDADVEKALRPEITKEQLGIIVDHLIEAIEDMIEVPEEESSDSESEDSTEIEDMSKSEDYQSDNEDEDKWDNIEKACWSGYKQEGMKEKDGRMVPNCVPVEKVEKTEGQLILSEEERAILEQEHLNEQGQVKKSLFNGFDPYDIVKRKFTTAQRERMAAEGQAMPDGSYPIGNKTDLMNAIRSWGRGG